MTMEELTRRWADLEEKLVRRERLRTREGSLETEREALEGRNALARAAWEKEQADVDALSRLTPQALWARIRGDKEERLSKEEREALAARAKLDQAERALEDADAALAAVRAELHGLEGLDGEREALLREKEALLLAAGGETARRLRALDERRTALMERLEELDEAVSAGEEVETALADLRHSLDDAESCGVWDIMGGGIIATAMKHDHMREAGFAGAGVREALQRFGRELRDVREFAELPGLELDGFTETADFWLDGLFVDIAVQGQINDAQTAVGELSRQVSALLLELAEEREDAASRLSALKAEYNRLLV